MKKGQTAIIGVDFDGTCVTHEFPHIGKSIGAEGALKELVARGHKLVLFTMRSFKDNSLRDALEWSKERDIQLCGINENHDQHTWTS